jgi:hypothetical protein
MSFASPSLGHSASINSYGFSQREAQLIREITEALPEFVEACKDAKADFVLLHQDAFAADYQAEEYLLLGKALKFAGITGKEVRITGTNRGTLGEYHCQAVIADSFQLPKHPEFRSRSNGNHRPIFSAPPDCVASS